MGLGLHLVAPLDAPDPRALLETLAEKIRGRDEDPAPLVEVSAEAPLLLAELHPGAEPLRIEAHQRKLVLEAATGTAGPGYHRHVCALAESLGVDLQIDWEIGDEDGGADETGWLHRRDEAELEEAFLDQLGATVARILELVDRGAQGIALALPSSHHFTHDGVIATQLGPRSEAWLRAILDDPRHGVDAFPWWSPERDAAYFRGLALSQMWTEVRWRTPIREEETALLDRVVTWAEKAHGLDPQVSLPWRAISELYEHLGEESLRATRAHVKAQAEKPSASIGYRRRPVRARLSGGWSLEIPGALAERWEERGTWVAWDTKRSVWFTSLTVTDDAGKPSPDSATTLASLPPLSRDSDEGEVLELESGELRGLAAFARDERDGETFYRLEAHAALREHAAVGTLVYTDEADREWALQTWGSLHHG
ncbi:MAG: sialidase family protein [Sandaracinaceae bacterium]